MKFPCRHWPNQTQVQMIACHGIATLPLGINNPFEGNLSVWTSNCLYENGWVCKTKSSSILHLRNISLDFNSEWNKHSDHGRRILGRDYTPFQVLKNRGKLCSSFLTILKKFSQQWIYQDPHQQPSMKVFQFHVDPRYSPLTSISESRPKMKQKGSKSFPISTKLRQCWVWLLRSADGWTLHKLSFWEEPIILWWTLKLIIFFPFAGSTADRNLRGYSQALFKNFLNLELIPENLSWIKDLFSFRLSPDHHFLLVCTLPEPWRRGAIEEIHKILLRRMAELLWQHIPCILFPIALEKQLPPWSARPLCIILNKIFNLFAAKYPEMKNNSDPWLKTPFERKAVVVHGGQPQMRQKFAPLATKKAIPHIDLLGPVLEVLDTYFGGNISPSGW